MSHQDLKGCHAECLQQALRWLFQGVSWSSIKFRNDCTWTPPGLSWAALLWAWSDELTLVERFHATRRIIQVLLSGQDNLATSYQAFTKLLNRWTPALIALLQRALRERMQTTLSARWRVQGWLLFGVDGSRVELPRTQSHEAAYSSTRKKKKKKSARRTKKVASPHAKKSNSPQMWVTTAWHAGTGLPWDWRTGPADSSERAHLLEMLPALPADALLAADAGFVGYDFMQTILVSKRQLLIRVGSNIRLLKKLDYVRESSGTVYLWPDQQAAQSAPPIVLRLVVVHNGKHPVYLLTSILSPAQLSDAQVAELYARRWGIEVFYRSLKQTYGRRKLRSGTAANACLELEWSLAGLWAMALYALVELQTSEQPEARLSIAHTLRAFRRILRDYRHPRLTGCRLRDRLQHAVIDEYQRSDKTSRDYPRKKKETPPGPPRLLHATKQQVQQAAIIKKSLAKERLTA